MGHEGEDAVAHGDIDGLPAARVLAREEGGADGEGGHEPAAGEVGEQVDGDGGGGPGAAYDAERAADGDVVDVVAHEVAVGAGLAEAGEGAVDDAGVDRGDGLVVDAEAVHDARAEALKDDIGATDELVKDLAGGLVLQVEGDGALAAAEGVVGGGAFRSLGVGGRAGAELGGDAGNGLDEGDIGAEVGEEHGAVGAGREAGEIEDFDAFESHGHREPPEPEAAGCGRGKSKAGGRRTLPASAIGRHG